jgi:hypothetical protein
VEADTYQPRLLKMSPNITYFEHVDSSPELFIINYLTSVSVRLRIIPSRLFKKHFYDTLKIYFQVHTIILIF